MSVGMIGMVVATCALLLTVGLIRGLIGLSRRYDWLDKPDERKRHHQPTSPLGGVAIFLAFWSAIAAIFLFEPERLALFSADVTVIFIGSIVIFFLGLYDDFRPMGAVGKLVVQSGVGTFLWFSGLGISRLWIPTVGGIDIGVFSLPITLIWFILLVNAVNIIDGMDGLAGGVSLIGLASVIVIGVRSNVPDAVLLAVILAGALGGFLLYNRPPARIFLGDNGSLFLGYIFAVIALWVPIKRFTVVAVYVPILAALVPLAEAAWSIIRRVSRGRPPTAADRGHLHFRLMNHGFSESGVRGLFYGLSAAGFGFSLAVAYGNRRFWMIVFAFFVLSLVGGLFILFRTTRVK